MSDNVIPFPEHRICRDQNGNIPKSCVNYSSCKNFEAEVYSIQYEEFGYHNNRKPGEKYYVGALTYQDPDFEGGLIAIHFSEMTCGYQMSKEEAIKLANLLLELTK
jgi:hypothetical protein